MRPQIRGSVKVNVEGKDLYGFMNELHSAKISCFEQYVKGNIFSGTVYRNDLRRIEKLSEKHGLTVTSFEYDTLSSEMIRRRYRFGLIVGMALVIAAYLYFSAVVVTIDIQGNQRVSEQTILTALEEIGIKKGTPFGQINYIYSENQLRLMVSDVAWAGMHRTGHRLVVEVTEIREKPEMLLERLPCSIVAAHDGQIDHTTVFDGMLMHKVGDYVHAGDVLVNGVTTDETGHTTLHHALGEISGIYSDSAEFGCRLTNERLNPTGRVMKQRHLELFSLDIPLYFGKYRYEFSQKESTENPITIFGKSIPISLRTDKFTELQRSETTLTVEQAREELMRKVFLYEKNFLSDCEIISRKIEEFPTDTDMMLNVSYLLRGDIGMPVEILTKSSIIQQNSEYDSTEAIENEQEQ